MALDSHQRMRMIVDRLTGRLSEVLGLVLEV